jgi:hypothetical protein
MAYPTVSKPYGLQPVNLIGGQVFAGATRYRRIASAYATAIFYGDLVKLTTALFKMAVVSGTTVVTGIQYTGIGQNSTLVQNTGSTVTGNSAVALLDATGTTKTLPIRIVDVVQDTSYVSGGNVLFPEVIVKINAPSMDGDGVSSGGHMYNNPLGL